MAIAKIKFGLNLLLVVPLAASMAIIASLDVQAQMSSNSVEAPAQQPEVTDHFSINSQPIPVNKSQLTELTNAPPATTATDATVLDTPIAPTVNQSSIQTGTPEVAQLPVDPGRSTRGGSSYVGIAGNIGLSGDTALGDGNFAIISKIGLTRAFAVRPGVILGDDATFLIPLTYEFSIRQAEALEEVLPIAPYLGAGVTISTGGDDDDNDDEGGVGLLLTGGVDIPLNRQFTANAGLNVGIADETDVGISVGVGYNFSGL